MNISNNICWLCLGNHDNLLEIYGRKGIDLNVGAILQEHFWFEVDTYATKNICGNCWNRVDSFHVFYNFVKSIHQQLISEVKTIIDNELAYSFKEEPIDIKDVFTDIVEITDFPAADELEEVNNSAKGPDRLSHRARVVKRVILAASDSIDSPDPTTDKLDADGGASKGPTTVALFSTQNSTDYLAQISKKVKVDRGTLKRPAVAHKTWNFKGTASSETTVFPALRSDEPEVDSGTTKALDTAEHNTRKYASTDKKDELMSLVSQYFNMACDLCDTTFSSYRDFRKHYKQVHDIQRGYLICCERKYNRLNLMLSHCQWHINPDAFKCEKCSSSFLDELSLRSHDKLMHSQKIVFNCNECNEKFATYFLLKAHRKKHQKLQFKCPICQECFIGKIDLRYHIRDNHSPEDEQEFRSSMKSLKKVDECVEEYKRFECDICNRSEICAKPFTTIHTYKFHYINVHTNELQKVQCDICGKWFKSKFRIAKHMRRHNSKTATCKICGHVSSNQDNLRAHIRRVHREASLECVVCGKKFKTKQVLQEHMAIHAGITDLYTCTFCTKTFRSNANKCAHRKRAHPAEYEKWKKERSLML